MFSKPTLSILAVAALSQILPAQDSTNFPSIGEVLRFDDRMDSIVGKDARIEVLSSGFAWGEGPVLIDDRDFLLFSDRSQPASELPTAPGATTAISSASTPTPTSAAFKPRSKAADFRNQKFQANMVCPPFWLKQRMDAPPWS